MQNMLERVVGVLARRATPCLPPASALRESAPSAARAPSREGRSPHARPHTEAQRRRRTPSPSISGRAARRFSVRLLSRRADDLRRARRLLAAIDERTVHEVRAWGGGTALLTPSLPRVWDANYLRVDHPGALNADRHRARGVRACDGRGIDAATDGRRGRDRRAPPSRRGCAASASSARGSCSCACASPRRRRSTRWSRPPSTRSARADGRSCSRRFRARTSWRMSSSSSTGDSSRRPGGAGSWFARAAWSSPGPGFEAGVGVGQVEDVATAIAARGRGLARSVVSAAARLSVAAGDELTFVVADADDTTPRLYEKLGFEPMGVTHRFVKNVGAQVTSRSFCASARLWSFLSDWFSIWRMRSRVTLKVRPTSSSVRGCSPPRP